VGREIVWAEKCPEDMSEGGICPAEKCPTLGLVDGQ